MYDLSPEGDAGGRIIPASCPSDLHDAPANYGDSCSRTNVCGDIDYGTVQCSGCSASTPPLPAGYGTSCVSTNSCGIASSPGTIQCDGTCSASAPSESLCPTVNITATPPSVPYNDSSTIDWSSTGNPDNCTSFTNWLDWIEWQSAYGPNNSNFSDIYCYLYKGRSAYAGDTF